jgi:hypothetical protein
MLADKVQRIVSIFQWQKIDKKFLKNPIRDSVPAEIEKGRVGLDLLRLR